MTDAPAALTFSSVDASYGPYHALFSVTFEVTAGSTMVMLGPNGAGKSSVARVASGLLVPSAGTVRVAGRDVTGAPAWRISRAGLAHVPEGRGVFSTLSVEENLVLAIRRRSGARALMGRSGTSSLLERTYERFAALAARRHDRAGVLSGGQQRLLSLAKVLVTNPKVLVADEVSLGLAPTVVDDVYRALREIRDGGAALVVVEQDIGRALSIAESALVLDHGAVAYFGPASGARGVVERVLSRRGPRDPRPA